MNIKNTPEPIPINPDKSPVPLPGHEPVLPEQEPIPNPIQVPQPIPNPQEEPQIEPEEPLQEPAFEFQVLEMSYNW